MKMSLLILVPLAMGTAAIAQDAPQTPPGAETPAGPESSPPPLASDAPAPPVDDAPAPSASSADTTAAAAPADTANYPACSRSVHDKCVQAQAGRRHMAHHKRR